MVILNKDELEELQLLHMALVQARKEIGETKAQLTQAREERDAAREALRELTKKIREITLGRASEPIPPSEAKLIDWRKITALRDAEVAARAAIAAER